MEPTDLTVQTLRDIRDQIKANGVRIETNGVRIEALQRRLTETERRLATELTAVVGAI